MGRNVELTGDRVLEIMRNADRPVWTASKLAERAGVARSTATKRLKNLAEAEEVETIQVGNATAYYIVGIKTQPVGAGEEPIKRDIRRSFEDEFVGDFSSPSQVSTFDGVATAGDKIQILVEGSPGEWERRKELSNNRTDQEEVQALISGELYEKATVPIEHADYPPDWDLELNIGPHIEETKKGSALIATGVKNHLIRPCDNALFLENVEVDWICPVGEGQELIDIGEPLAHTDEEISNRTSKMLEEIDLEEVDSLNPGSGS